MIERKSAVIERMRALVWLLHVRSADLKQILLY